MTNRSRNFFVLTLFVGLLAAAAVVIALKPTLLGLDLQGGVELTYQAEPTPQVPKVTNQAIADALNVIRKKTDALGVSQPSIQQSGSNEITVGLPAVKNPQKAAEEVGTPAQLEFYDWEADLRNNGNLFDSLYGAVKYAQTQKPTATATDIPPEGIAPAIRARFHNNMHAIEMYYDQRNDTSDTTYYLFNANHQLVVGPDQSCTALANDVKANQTHATGQRLTGTCGTTLPVQPKGSQVLRVPEGITLVEPERPTTLPANVAFHEYYVLEDDAALTGNDVTDPKVETDSTGAPTVTMNFTSHGQRAFAEITKRLAQRGAKQVLTPGETVQDTLQNFAIVLDGKLVSLASIDYRQYPDGINGKMGAEITNVGNFSAAENIQQQLQIGSLPIQLKLISQDQVSATLGQQALHQGLVAGILGLALTLLFLLIFYRLLGIVAGVGLIAYGVLFFALIKLIPITMTLPGIAGLILTVGVAADANIVIFERVKEEVRGGASIPKAIREGYTKALRAIIDANAVTFGVAFILFMLATASVQGFAFTLGVGTLVSLFTAVVATSAMLGLLGQRGILANRAGLLLRSHRQWTFDFMGRSKWFFSMSGTILMIGALAIAGLGIHFGIDFESGTRITTPITAQTSVTDVRNSLDKIGYGNAEVQMLVDRSLAPKVVQISLSQLQPSQLNRVEQSLQPLGLTSQKVNVDSIGPTFGQQVEHSAILAIIASLLLISLYIAFRFSRKYAVPVMIALAHDLLITAGVYALTGRQVSTDTVAALLTILGYSLYDTIIVFDRIRENAPRMRRATFSQIANRSMSEVLTRSLATSFSTLLPITALLLFGGSTLQDFAFALLIGVASGTYSSIFIATPVLMHWKERETGYRRRRQLIESQLGYVPAYETEESRKAADNAVTAQKNRVKAATRTAPIKQATGLPPATNQPSTPARGTSLPSMSAAAPNADKGLTSAAASDALKDALKDAAKDKAKDRPADAANDTPVNASAVRPKPAPRAQSQKNKKRKHGRR